MLSDIDPDLVIGYSSASSQTAGQNSGYDIEAAPFEDSLIGDVTTGTREILCRIGLQPSLKNGQRGFRTLIFVRPVGLQPAATDDAPIAQACSAEVGHLLFAVSLHFFPCIALLIIPGMPLLPGFFRCLFR